MILLGKRLLLEPIEAEQTGVITPFSIEKYKVAFIGDESLS